MPVFSIGSTTYKPLSEFDRLDRLHDLGYRNRLVPNCGPAVGALRICGLPTALAHWALDLGQRAAGNYRESESPRP